MAAASVARRGRSRRFELPLHAARGAAAQRDLRERMSAVHDRFCDDRKERDDEERAQQHYGAPVGAGARPGAFARRAGQRRARIERLGYARALRGVCRRRCRDGDPLAPFGLRGDRDRKIGRERAFRRRSGIVVAIVRGAIVAPSYFSTSSATRASRVAAACKRVANGIAGRRRERR